MQRHHLLGTLLRLGVGCQAQTAWHPDSPIANFPTIRIATSPNYSILYRERRSC